MSLVREPSHCVQALLACPVAQRPAFLSAHPDCVRLEVIEVLKQRSDDCILSAAATAAKIIDCAFLVATHLPHEPLAYPLALWAQGNWEMHHHPGEAIRIYETVLAIYRSKGDVANVARLLGNLVSVYGDCGQFDEAQCAYEEARSIYLKIGTTMARHLHALEQNYGYLLHEQGQYEAAMVAHDRALQLAHQLQEPVFVTEVRINASLTLGMLGRMEEGIAAFYHDREIAAQHQQVMTIARIDMNLGELYAALGKPAEALHVLQQARTQFEHLHNDHEVAQVFLQEGILFARIGALREARRSYRQARIRFEALALLPSLGKTLVWQAISHRRDGDYVQAARLLDEAEALWTKLDQAWWRARVLFERVELALVQEDVQNGMTWLHPVPWMPDNPLLLAQRTILLAELLTLRWHQHGSAHERAEARQAYTDALMYARQHRDTWMLRRTWAGMGKLALPDQPEAAKHCFAEAIAYDDRLRRTLSVEELKASFHSQFADLFPLMIRLALDQAHPLDALRYTWYAKGSALLDLMYAMDADRIRMTDAQTQVQMELDQARQRLASQRWKAAQTSSDAMPEDWHERDDPMVPILEQHLADLRYQRNHARVAPHQLRLDNPLALLQQMEADMLIEYMNCDGTILALQADRTGTCQAYWLAEATVFLDLLDALHLTFQNVLTQPPDRRVQYSAAWTAECLPLLQCAYELLMAPLGALPDHAHVLLSPCDPLYLFPFAALWDGQHYLMDRVLIEMIPSGALFAAPVPAPAATTAPVIIASSADGKIPDVYQEAAAIQSVFNASTCLVDDPDDLAYLGNLTTPPPLLHLSAHHVLVNTSPLLCALHLTRNFLSVEQCYALRLAGTHLVTLSGCSTAAGMETGGALLAFQSAFLVAGARHVLSSLWSIDARPTVTWMAHFYRLLAQGLSVPVALCLTQRTLRHDPAMGHPAIWAAFMVSRR